MYPYWIEAKCMECGKAFISPASVCVHSKHILESVPSRVMHVANLLFRIVHLPFPNVNTGYRPYQCDKVIVTKMRLNQHCKTNRD
jgi:hypothetical protein